MATGTFSLYQSNGTTPVAIPKPNFANWENITRGSFPNGLPRISIYKKVVWKFPLLSAADYQKFEQYRQAGRQTFETWKKPVGGTAGTFIVCTGILADTIPGIKNQHGEYKGVTVIWTMVLPS